MNNQKYRLFQKISRSSGVKFVPATNIDYYLSKIELFKDCKIVELYCHPHYKEDVFLDDSPSYLKHDRQPMMKQIQLLKEVDGIDFLSWEDTY